MYYFNFLVLSNSSLFSFSTLDNNGAKHGPYITDHLSVIITYSFQNVALIAVEKTPVLRFLKQTDVVDPTLTILTIIFSCKWKSFKTSASCGWNQLHTLKCIPVSRF